MNRVRQPAAAQPAWCLKTLPSTSILTRPPYSNPSRFTIRPLLQRPAKSGQALFHITSLEVIPDGHDVIGSSSNGLEDISGVFQSLPHLCMHVLGYSLAVRTSRGLP